MNAQCGWSITASAGFLSSSFKAKYFPAGGSSQTTTLATPLLSLLTTQVASRVSAGPPFKQPEESLWVFMAGFYALTGRGPASFYAALILAAPASTGGRFAFWGPSLFRGGPFFSLRP